MDDLALLRLQIEWGADEALGEDPRDQFTPAVPSSPARSPVSAVPAPAPVQPVALLSPTANAALATSQAETAGDLETLHRTLDAFHACPLRATASTTVSFSGNPAAGLILVAEAPGPEDDRSGQAFSGPAGERLDRVLRSAELSRADLLLTFLVPWRPPGGRPPSDAEIAQCLPFLYRLIALAHPHHLVLLGAAPLRVLTDREDGRRKARGQWAPVVIPGVAAPIPALSMLSPDLWLSNPKNKRTTWTDLLLLKEALASSSVRF